MAGVASSTCYTLVETIINNKKYIVCYASNIACRSFHLCLSLVLYIRNRCVSVHQGTLLPKKQLNWPQDKNWRLSVEDPFETHTSYRPHDLGNVLEQPGQVKSDCFVQCILKRSFFWLLMI